MKPMMLLLIILISSSASLRTGPPKQPVIVVRRPTIIAFFAPVTQAELEKDADTNETLSDFQAYTARVRKPLHEAGIDFHEIYARSFRVRTGTTVKTFRPGKIKVGYYFISPGKEPRVEYGVNTDIGIAEIAGKYFGIAVKPAD